MNSKSIIFSKKDRFCFTNSASNTVVFTNPNSTKNKVKKFSFDSVVKETFKKCDFSHDVLFSFFKNSRDTTVFLYGPPWSGTEHTFHEIVRETLSPLMKSIQFCPKTCLLKASVISQHYRLGMIDNLGKEQVEILKVNGGVLCNSKKKTLTNRKEVWKFVDEHCKPDEARTGYMVIFHLQRDFLNNELRFILLPGCQKLRPCRGETKPPDFENPEIMMLHNILDLFETEGVTSRRRRKLDYSDIVSFNKNSFSNDVDSFWVGCISEKNRWYENLDILEFIHRFTKVKWSNRVKEGKGKKQELTKIVFLEGFEKEPTFAGELKTKYFLDCIIFCV